MADMPWWAQVNPVPYTGPDPMDRQSMFGTADRRKSSWFYYGPDNTLTETADKSEFVGQSTGMFDVIRNDDRQFPLERATLMVDPWKQNNVMDVFSPAMDQVMDYYKIPQEDAAGRSNLRTYYGFDRQEDIGFWRDQGISVSKFLGAAQGVDGAMGQASPFAGIMGQKSGDASETDMPLAFKEYAVNQKWPDAVESPEVEYALELRSSRMYREITRFDADFNPKNAWDNLSEIQRKFLTDQGYDSDTWMSQDLDRANNAMDYFVRTEKFIRDRVYSDQLQSFWDDSNIFSYTGNSLSSWAVNSFANDMDNLVFTALTLPAGGWGGQAVKFGGKMDVVLQALETGINKGVSRSLGMLGIPERMSAALALGGSAPSSNAFLRNLAIEGSALGGVQMVGETQASTDLYNAFNLGNDLEQPSWSGSFITGAMAGAAFVGALTALPKLIKGATLRGFDMLPDRAKQSIQNAPVIGNAVLNLRYTDSLRRIMGAVGSDADQFYLFPYLEAPQAALLMHDESLGREMILRQLTSYFGDNKLVSKFDHLLSRDYLHAAGLSHVDIANQLSFITNTIDPNKGLSADTVVRYIDDFVKKAKELKPDSIEAYRIKRATEIAEGIDSSLGDIRYNEARPLSRRDRRMIEQLRGPITKKKGETDAAFSTRAFARRLDLAKWLAHSENATDLTEALSILKEAQATEGLLPKWGDKVINRLESSIEEVGAKTTLEKKIIRLERMYSEVKTSSKAKGVRLVDIDLESTTIKTLDDLITGLSKYRREIRMDPPAAFKKTQKEYRQMVNDRYVEHLRLLDKLTDKKLIDVRGRGTFEGTLAEWRDLHKKTVDEETMLGVPAEEIDKPLSLEFLEAVEGVNKARRKRDKRLRDSASLDVTTRDNVRKEALKEYIETRDKLLDPYAPQTDDEVILADAASRKRQVDSFDKLSTETQQEILKNIFDSLQNMGAEVGDLPNTLLQLGDNTPMKTKFRRLISSMSVWPQAQRNTFLSHLSAVRGLAALHDSSPTFAGTFRTLGTPLSLRAASYSAVADAMQVISRGLQIKDRYGSKVKGSMNAHLMEMRQSGKKFSVDMLPEDLKSHGEQMVKDLNEWNDSVTAYFTNVLTAGHEVGLLEHGINPARYVPHRLPSDMDAASIDSFVDKFVKLRIKQYSPTARLDLTHLEAIGLIVRTENNEGFSIPEGSPFDLPNLSAEERIAAVKSIIQKGENGLRDMQRLQPPPPKTKKPSASHGERGQLMYSARTPVDPSKSYDMPEFMGRMSPLSTTDDLVSLYWDVTDGLYDSVLPTDADKARFIDSWQRNVVRRTFGQDYWHKTTDETLIVDGDEFSKISPLHDHVQRMWRRYGVVDGEQQEILRAAYANIPQSVLGIRIMDPESSIYGFANPLNKSITATGEAVDASLFLHETGHFVLFRNKALTNVMDSMLQNLNTQDLMALLQAGGIVHPQQIAYALVNPDELGAVLWDAYMTRNGRSRIITGSPKANWARKTLWTIFRKFKALFTGRDNMLNLSDEIYGTFDDMSDSAIRNLQRSVDKYKSKDDYNPTGLDASLHERVFGTKATPKQAHAKLEDIIRRADTYIKNGVAPFTYIDNDFLEGVEHALVAVRRLDQDVTAETFVVNLESKLGRQVQPELKAMLKQAAETMTVPQMIESLQRWGGLNEVALYIDFGLSNDFKAAASRSFREWVEKNPNILMDISSKVAKSLRKRYGKVDGSAIHGMSTEDISGEVLANILERNDDSLVVLSDDGTVDASKTRSKIESYFMTEAKGDMKNLFAKSARQRDVIERWGPPVPEEAPTVFTDEMKKEAVAQTQEVMAASVAKSKEHLARKDRKVVTKDTEWSQMIEKDRNGLPKPEVSEPEVQKVIRETPGATAALDEAIKTGDVEVIATVVAAAEDVVTAKETPIQAQEATVAASEEPKATSTPPEAPVAPEAVKKPRKGPPKKAPKEPATAGGTGEPPSKPPVDATLEGVDPEWFFKKKQEIRNRKLGFTRIRDQWKPPAILHDKWRDVDLAKLYRDSFTSTDAYTPEFKHMHRGRDNNPKLAMRVAAEHYVANMTHRNLSRNNAVDIKDLREAVARNSRPDSIEGDDRVFSEADFSTPEGQALAREFGLLNDLDTMIKEYAKSSGTRINAQLLLKTLIKDRAGLSQQWNGNGLTYADLYNSFEDSLARVLATNENGSQGMIEAEDREMASRIADQFREKYLRAIGKFPSQDQDSTFNKITQIAKNATLGILAPVAAPTIAGVETVIALGRSVTMDPSSAAKHAGDLIAEAVSGPMSKVTGKAMNREMLEDLVFFVENTDSSPIGRFSGEREAIGDGRGLSTSAFERLKANIKHTAATLKKNDKGQSRQDRALDFLVAASQTVAQTGSDFAGMRYVTDLVRFMGARMAKRELIRYLPNMYKFRSLWDQMAIDVAETDKARQVLIDGWLRESGLPYYVWNRSNRNRMFEEGMLESIQELFPDVNWGKSKNMSRAHELNLNKARDNMLGLDQEAGMAMLDRVGDRGNRLRREALSGIHSYIEEGVTLFSPELRGIYRLDRQDQLTPWKRLLFFWQNYPMAFYNVDIQQAFRNQRLPMALGNVMTLFVLELNARMGRDLLLADNEEKRQESLERWKRFLSLDPVDFSSELLQGAAMVPILGQSQWMLSDVITPMAMLAVPEDRRRKYYPKTFGSSPVMGIANRFYRSLVTNPVQGITRYVDQGDTSGLERAASDAGTLLLDATPGVNSWGRAGWNLGHAAFVGESTKDPFGALPDHIGTWIHHFAVDQATKRKRSKPEPTVKEMAQATTPQTPKTGRYDALETLKGPLGR